MIGSGPAGLMAAWRAAQSGKRVIVLEALPSPGRKLLASGSGKCNLTNILAPRELALRFGAVSRFLTPALYELPPEALRQWFAGRGVPSEVTDGFHVFPCSRRAADILEALLDAGRTAGVRVRCDWPVERLWIEQGVLRGVYGPDEAVLELTQVVIAGGGLGYPALGAKGRAYELARQAGHTVVKPVPALVGLRTEATWPGDCRGIVLADAEVSVDAKTVGRGELLFTHHGISGPAVIDISGCVAGKLAMGEPVTVLVNCFREMTARAWGERLDGWRREDGRKHLRNLLAPYTTQALADALCLEAGVADGTKMAELSAAVRDRLVTVLTRLPLTIIGTEGWPKAMATRGGVALSEVDSRSLESRVLKGLFFAGEVLDVDGPCGGYNLQWAFSSGYLAGALNSRQI